MLSKEEIFSVARLARLDLKEEEVELYRNQLSKIIDLFQEIDDIDLKNVEETSQITGIYNTAFPDDVESNPDLNPSGPKDNLKNTPLRDDSKILTPKVIEK